MKEAYVKPAFYIERFSLTQNIASGCGAMSNGSLGSPMVADKNTCAWSMGNLALFVDTATNGCSFTVDPNGEFNGICYNAPNSSNAIFGA